jgi:hypothetical protein
MYICFAYLDRIVAALFNQSAGFAHRRRCERSERGKRSHVVAAVRAAERRPLELRGGTEATANAQKRRRCAAASCENSIRGDGNARKASGEARSRHVNQVL